MVTKYFYKNIMKVFLDGWFNTLTDYQYQFYSTCEKIPTDCELIGTTFYDNCYYNISQTIDQLLNKTKLLVVNLSEPTNEQTLHSLLSGYRDRPVKFFSDVVLNFEANILFFGLHLSVFNAIFSKNLPILPHFSL